MPNIKKKLFNEKDTIFEYVITRQLSKRYGHYVISQKYYKQESTSMPNLG